MTRTGRCTAVGVTRFRVQQVLNRAGFTRVRNLRQLPNGNWTALASFRGRNGTVTVNGRTGRIANFTPGAAPALTQAQVVRQLQRDGFRNIKNIRRGTLGGQPVWIVTATKGNRECLHQADGRTGKVTRTGRCTAVGFTRAQVQRSLGRRGFINVRGLRQLPNGNWTAQATRRGRNGTVTVNGTSGAVTFAPGGGAACRSWRRCRSRLRWHARASPA